MGEWGKRREVRNVQLSDIGESSEQWPEKQVVDWFIEIEKGERQVEHRTVEVAQVRTNLFVTNLREETVGGMVDEIRHLVANTTLLVARLPLGGFVDVDTPHMCEAVHRAGLKMVGAQVVGTFSEEDCKRIGIASAWPATIG
jgi:hypothetical protein